LANHTLLRRWPVFKAPLPGRFSAPLDSVVPETVQAAHRHIGERASLGNESVVADQEGDFPLQDVKRFFFPASNAHEITSPFGPRSFNGKPQATANLGRSRLRLAVKRGDYFVSVAMDVRRWTATWTHDGFEHGVLSVRVVAGCHEAVDITDDGNGLAFVRLTESRQVSHFCHVAL
jgi:hypothetical protein